jgi:hypothetical protein
VRGLRPEAAKLRAAGGGEVALVRRLREAAQGGEGSREQEEEVRGLQPDHCKLQATVGSEEAVVRWLREGARGGEDAPARRPRGRPCARLGRAVPNREKEIGEGVQGAHLKPLGLFLYAPPAVASDTVYGVFCVPSYPLEPPG